MALRSIELNTAGAVDTIDGRVRCSTSCKNIAANPAIVHGMCLASDVVGSSSTSAATTSSVSVRTLERRRRAPSAACVTASFGPKIPAKLPPTVDMEMILEPSTEQSIVPSDPISAGSRTRTSPEPGSVNTTSPSALHDMVAFVDRQSSSHASARVSRFLQRHVPSVTDMVPPSGPHTSSQ